MEDKFAKRTNCGYCGNHMEAEYRSKKFCSDKCRVYFNRENKVPKPEVQIKDLNQPTNLVEPITKPKINVAINTIGEPKEGSMAFFTKYDCMTYEELKNKK